MIMRIIGSVFGLVAITSLWAQNLVVNPSFEEYDVCPETPAQWATGWLTFRGTPDLYNSCNVSGWYDVPSNAFGYQEAAEGEGYAGIITYSSVAQNLREYLGAPLLEQIQPGDTIHVSMKFAVGCFGWYHPSPRFSASGIGMFFSTTQWSTSNAVLPNWAATASYVVPTDTLGWTTLEGEFIADSAYSYVILGNPFVDSLTDTMTLDTLSNFTNAMSFVDEIYVSRSPEGHASTGMRPLGINGIQVFPNPCGERLFLNANDLELGSTEYRIVDPSGRIVEKGQLTAGVGIQSVRTGHLPQGSFVLHLNGRSSAVRALPFIHINP